MLDLFTPIKIKGQEIKNRIVIPPMVCFGWTDNKGLVSTKHIEHYQARAKGGTGLIIVEASCVNKKGRLTNEQLGIWSDEQIEGLKKLSTKCSKYGSTNLIQIHHAGFKTAESVSPVAVTSSEYLEIDRKNRALSIGEIHDLQDDFLKAALRAKKAGFAGVELHGAHGFLISQFVSPLVNKRSDEYGGSFKNRLRFPIEIIRELKKELAEDFIIAYRMGGNEPTLKEGIKIAKTLEKNGIDLLHVSAGIGQQQEVPKDFPYNYLVYLGTEINKQVKIPVITVNGIRTPKQAAYLIENNLADFVAIGRGHLVDPNWANKAKKEIDVISCLECTKCSWFTKGENCPQYNY